MSVETMTVPKGFAPAKRGDLAVITRGQEPDLKIELGRVASVSREGMVKQYARRLFASGPEVCDRVDARASVQVVSALKVDVDAVLAVYAEHTWGATGSTGDMVRPYSSVAEVREVVRAARR